MKQPPNLSNATAPSSEVARHSTTLRDQAQYWVTRLVAKDISGAELDRLEAWLNAAPDNRQAFARERALWQDLHALSDALTTTDTASTNVIPLQPAHRHRLVRFVPLAIAASFAAFVMAPSLILSLQADHRTAVGEVRSLALPDGTTAMLDSDSAIAVDFDNGKRSVQLLSGRAWFNVRHESRPFVVAASGGQTLDIGTAFEVRHEGNAVEVGVTEGSVQVHAPNGAKGRPMHMGERARYSAAGLAFLPSQPASQLANWRNGEILFDKQPIDIAIAEIGRYRRAKIWTLGDFSGVAPVSGLFLIERPDEALQTLARMRDLRITTLPGGYIIVRPSAIS